MEISERYWRDDFLDAVKLENGWVFVTWVNNGTGRLSKGFIRRLRKIERQIVEDGLPGWFCNSEPDHQEMQRLIVKFGAEHFFDENGLNWFRKFLPERRTPCAEAAEMSSRMSLTA